MSQDLQQNHKVARKYAAAVAASNEKIRFAVVLIGSVVRGTDTSRSDLDLLLVSDEKLSVPKHPPPFQIQTFTRERFLKRLHEGDDFTGWSVRFGRPLRGAQYWRSIVGPDPEAFWPDWQRKLGHAHQRLIRAAAILKTGDLSAAAEETLSTADHTARAILLKGHVFPLSRSEMPRQLERVRKLDLARTLERLSTDNESGPSLRDIQIYLKRILRDLDKRLYERTDRHYGEIERKKNLFEVAPAARPRISGYMRLLLKIVSLVSEEAKRQKIDLGGIEVRPAWSNEYEENSAVVLDVEVDIEAEHRFLFWESLGERLNSMTNSLSLRETFFLQENLSLIVSRSNGV
jgi:predicted nucleotidyltransferase